MYLRSLTLSGFKTFASRTEIRFEEGVTAIVGPNGSGKTNIVDAFRWVLGETQARDLRGSKMHELVYGGGLRRSAAAAAEVSLLIDNSDGRLPVDYREVEIKRHLDRSGESDYFLNGTRVRRRDVVDMLAATGLAMDGYNIVAQPDIDFVVTCTPAQRRELLEEAARIRGIKAKRAEAAERLRQLAQNMLRLEDVRHEIEPRLEIVKAQAEAARRAHEAQQRLDVLRGSIAWEEWREARDTHKRAQASLRGLEGRLVEAREQSAVAEAEFQFGRRAMQEAQDRRLRHQRAVSELRLDVAHAEHELALTNERRDNQLALAQVAAEEERELLEQSEVASALRAEVAAEVSAAESALETMPQPLPARATAADEAAIRETRSMAEAKRRDAAAAGAKLATVTARRQFLEEWIERSRGPVEDAQRTLPSAREAVDALREPARRAADAAAELVALRAEVEGLRAVDAAAEGLPRLADVLAADPGYEVALSAALGPLADALVASSEPDARAAVQHADRQTTVLYPRPAPEPATGSLYEHVRFAPEYESLARRFLGPVLVEEPAPTSVTVGGEYRHPGLARAGEDVRAQLAVRRRELLTRIAELEPVAANSELLARRQQDAERQVRELEGVAAGAARLQQSRDELSAVQTDEERQQRIVTELEIAAHEADARAETVLEEYRAAQERALELAAEVRQIELERSRLTERVVDRARHLKSIDADLERIEAAREARRRRIAVATAEAQAADASVEQISTRIAALRERLESVEAEADGEQRVAELTRAMIGLEEARVDSRLRLTTLEGSLNLIAREAELAAARMEQLRATMPEGMAPEEVPGGKAREREMRSLERLLEEIGPTNPLAENEFAELDHRYGNLQGQLDDLQSARADLEQLIERLQAQEESRYEAVFGAVTTHFRDYFAELSGGGRATLRNVRTDEGAAGLEIVVQPPRKRLQNVTLLSSGERALTALALVMALQEVNPSAFVILDEVDAALDDANVDRFGEALQRLGRERQFLVVTHNHATMARAAALYGIHLDESGASHIVSARLADVTQEAQAPAVSA